MTTLLQTKEDTEFLEKVIEVINHPSWHGCIDEKETTTLLQDQPIMTYLLRQDSASKIDFWLSHKKGDREIHHRHFTIMPFSDGWIFVNHGAPPCEDLNRFIQGALACKD